MKQRGKKGSFVVAVVACCLLWGLCAHGEAASTISDADWVSMNPGIPGVGGNIYAMAVDAVGNLYVGGDFTIAGTVRANHIAKWDNATWSALGSGVEALEAFCVGALALDAAGTLYTGGEFLKAGGVTVNNIAKWDNDTWSALGPTMGVLYPRGNVGALALDASGNLYAGGSFEIIGGVTVNNIAKWNGTSWSALGSGIDGGVGALAVDASGTLYAGGVFTKAGGVTVNHIAKWDGSAWSALGSGVEGGVSFLGPWEPFVRTLALDASGTLYAGGDFTKAGGSTAYGIAKWNGRRWSPLGLGLGKGWLPRFLYYVIFPPFVDRIVFDPQGHLYVVGSFTRAGLVKAVHVAKWNGFSWSAVAAMKNDSVGPIYDLAFDSAGTLYAGGCFTTAGSGTAHNIAKWDGATWSALGSGLDGCVSSLAVDASGTLYAGGSFATAGDKVSPYIAKCILP